MAFAPTAIDLSRLPAPQVIETIEFEQIVAEMKADFKARWPEYEFDTLETDPVVIAIQVCAYREMMLRDRINSAATANMLAKATAADLDNLAALFGLERMTIVPASGLTPAVMETDEQLKRRIQLAPDAFSMGGPRGAYVFHGLSIDPSVYDCWAWKREAGRVEVVLAGYNAVVPYPAATAALVESFNGAQVADSVIARLVDLFANEQKTPLTDVVSVVRAEIVTYPVTATLYIPRGPDPETVRTLATNSLRSYAASRNKVATSVYGTGIDAALQVGGVERVVRSSPVGDVLITDRQIAKLGAVNITVQVD